MRGVSVAAILATAEGHDLKVTSALQFDEASAKNRPVSKVITLLKDMLAQLEKEAEEDEEIYDQLACWCETNDKEKTKAVADAQARITDLTTKIEEMTATGARLNTEIKNWRRRSLKTRRLSIRQLPSVRSSWQSSMQRRRICCSPCQP
jgi:predicted RNase H-like nuclease (RuvC/YqgF family)